MQNDEIKKKTIIKNQEKKPESARVNSTNKLDL